ncbi:MAG: DNA mismatch repair endonuclease MutL [Verrucomicrobia bacterium]|nr:DNA mismatch repair endonuclease MutL [Verrucomicrobiota bacterium]
MQGRIRVLDEQLINKIAAGEVVENSASVVKELVENSIDAGASEVGVWIKAGGRQLIRVADNGSGMGRDDALLCLERHATSKIRAAEDLVEVATLGFRGEAVPAIASVSKLTLLTNPAQGMGTELWIEGGKIQRCLDAARSLGTTFEVAALFYNTPARRAFQKSISHDAHEVEQLLQTVALAYPHTRFDLTSDERLLFSYRAEEGELLVALGERIKKVLGEGLWRSLRKVDFKEEGVSIWGYISEPECTKPNRGGQYLFLNGRAITSPAVSEMVRMAYGSRLPERRHPLFVLHLQLPGAWVDVNVHPQKKHVRIRNEKELQDWIFAAMEGAWPLPKRGTVLRACEPQVPYVQVYPNDLKNWDLGRVKAPGFDDLNPPNITNIERVEIVEPRELSRRPKTNSSGHFGISDFLASPLPYSPPSANAQPSLVEIPAQVLGLYGRYLLVDGESLGEGKKGLAFVDVLAARRRILYEELIMAKRQSGAQMLLIPLTIDLLPAEKRALEERQKELEALGIGVRFCGSHSALIDAVPAHVEMEATEDFLRALLATKEELAVVAAMRGAVSSQISSTEEGRRILQRLLKCAVPFFDPKGKPLIAYLEPKELFS